MIYTYFIFQILFTSISCHQDYYTDEEKSILQEEFVDSYMKHYEVYGYMDYFYNENRDQFEPDDDDQIDKEVWVDPTPYVPPPEPDLEEIKKRAKEAKEAEEQVDRDLAERLAKWKKEQAAKGEL